MQKTENYDKKQERDNKTTINGGKEKSAGKLNKKGT